MISVKDVTKTYQMGDTTVHALRGVSLEIEDGDFVAIMGPSGSGKSTMMHVLGLLDVPTSGSYRINGHETSQLDDDELAVLRREEIGFVFQQFNLLPRLSAAANVSLPLLYSERKPDFDRAIGFLKRVGLGQRVGHRPNELSGGQQQRVAIARSLINSPRVLLADEPTGNLDSASTEEILGILRELNQQGITVVIVTHEEDIGARARRRIRMRDGVIQSDERLEPKPSVPAAASGALAPKAGTAVSVGEFTEHLRQGFQALAANKVRTGLSMLGILIGVAAVVAMLAIGNGAQKAIEAQLASLGSNLLVLRPGAVRTAGVRGGAGAISRLTFEDATAIQSQVPGVKSAAPVVNGNAQVVFEDENWSTQVIGAVPAYAEMHAAEPLIGRFFTWEESQKKARVALLGATVVRNLFGDDNPIGEYVKVNHVIFQVIGVLPEKGATGFRDQDDVIVIPAQTAMYRVLGKRWVDYIDIESTPKADTDAIEDKTIELMKTRHRVPVSIGDDAFQIRSNADVQEALSESSRTMTVLLASIAAISLLVGGIGIMNIMLVSVIERTREIGLRKAVGARRVDIMLQFLIEAVVVSAVGGLIGIALGWSITFVLSQVAGWATYVSPASVGLAFLFSASIGVVFGIYPARQASALNPIDALRTE